MDGGGVIAELSAAIDAVLAVDPDTLTDAELHESVVELQRQTSRLTAGRARIVGAWDAHRVWAINGCNSASAKLRRECTMEASAARAEIRRARQLRHMPHTMSALAEGSITTAHADTLGRVCTPERAGLFARDEEVLVTEAKRLCTF